MLQACWPAYHEGHAHSALLGARLIEAKGCTAKGSPAIGEVGNRISLPRNDLPVGSDIAIAVISAIVGHEDDKGVFSQSLFIEMFLEASNVGVEIVDYRGVGLHSEGFVLLRRFGEFVPVANVRSGRGICESFVNEALLAKAREPFFAKDIPAFIEAALVFVHELLGDIQRGMRGVEGEVGKERPLLSNCLVDGLDGMVGEGVGSEPILGDFFGLALPENIPRTSEVVDRST